MNLGSDFRRRRLLGFSFWNWHVQFASLIVYIIVVSDQVSIPARFFLLYPCSKQDECLYSHQHVRQKCSLLNRKCTETYNCPCFWCLPTIIMLLLYLQQACKTKLFYHQCSQCKVTVFSYKWLSSISEKLFWILYWQTYDW